MGFKKRIFTIFNATFYYVFELFRQYYFQCTFKHMHSFLARYVILSRELCKIHPMSQGWLSSGFRSLAEDKRNGVVQLKSPVQ